MAHLHAAGTYDLVKEDELTNTKIVNPCTIFIYIYDSDITVVLKDMTEVVVCDYSGS